MNSPIAVSVVLNADPRNVSKARQVLRGALARSDAEHLADDATLVLSELITNAFVHAGTSVRVHLWSTPQAVRVEVEDGAPHLPTRRKYAETAGTGRGLQLLDALVDRWGTSVRGPGKTVWFEIGPFDATGSGGPTEHPPSDEDPPASPGEYVDVTLRQVPLLMHVAWQEHAATLLREYLLHVLDEDPHILDKHAQASDALHLLDDQLPSPELSDDADALMADAVEPKVSADEVVLHVPLRSVRHFATLDELLRAAIAAARKGRFLSPPTQPEIDEMRQWMCSEVARQASGGTTATPWVARSDVRATLADQATLTRVYAELAEVDRPLLATDEASVIVAVSPEAVALLGYDSSDELLGRRVIVVVPSRFHQAHIAGTTLHATNGRDPLLGVPITVPMVRRDGTEVLVQIEVRAERFRGDHRVYVARFVAA